MKFSYTEGKEGSFLRYGEAGSFMEYDFKFNALIGEHWNKIGKSSEQRAIERANMAYLEYGGDGTGGVFDAFMYNLNLFNKFNPFMSAYDAMNGVVYGTDHRGNPQNGVQTTMNAIGAIPFMSVEKGIASEGVTTVYRAVDDAELAIIKETGKFTLQPGGVEAKYFAKSKTAALFYGEKIYPKGYTVIKGTAPSSIKSFWHAGSDAWKSFRGGAYIVPPDALNVITPILPK